VPFASCGLIAAAIIIFLLPETKGKNLLETIEELEGGYKKGLLTRSKLPDSGV